MGAFFKRENKYKQEPCELDSLIIFNDISDILDKSKFPISLKVEASKDGVIFCIKETNLRKVYKCKKHAYKNNIVKNIIKMIDIFGSMGSSIN